jgi:hypothetical protein
VERPNLKIPNKNLKIIICFHKHPTKLNLKTILLVTGYINPILLWAKTFASCRESISNQALANSFGQGKGNGLLLFTQKESCQQLKTAWTFDLSKFFVLLRVKINCYLNMLLIDRWLLSFSMTLPSFSMNQVSHNRYHNVQ